MSDPSLFDQPDDEPEPEPVRPRARNTDPWTSHAAAASVDLTRGQQVVFNFLDLNRGRTWIDEELVMALDGVLSASGVRTRRSELVDMKLVEYTGESRTMTTGRKAREYRLA